MPSEVTKVEENQSCFQLEPLRDEHKPAFKNKSAYRHENKVIPQTPTIQIAKMCCMKYVGINTFYFSSCNMYDNRQYFN